MTTRRTVRRPALILAALGAAFALAATPARADEFTDRVNAPFKAIPEKLRSDLVVLPALAEMEKPPEVVKTQARAALLGSKGPGWRECAEWAQRPKQQAVLEKLAEVTKEEDRLKAYVFAQPYGVEGVDVGLVSKGMYTELGDPPLLAAAQHLYMPGLESAGVLAHVEASRLAEAGDALGAIKVLTDWLFFCRQVADRPTIAETRWAMVSMKAALERVRDVVYGDFRAETHLSDLTTLREAITRLKERRGFLMLDRLRLPTADFDARDQLLGKVMDPSGRPSETSFGPVMARVDASERPLKLFSSTAFWDGARGSHANRRDTAQVLSGLREDWRRRWELPPFDKYVSTTTDYRKVVRTSTKYATLNGAFDSMDDLFSLRQQLRAELGATRMAMGVYGFFLRNRTLPQTMASARPEFIDAVDKDPYSPRGADLSFFVPERDTAKPGEERRPHVVNVFPPPPAPQFSIPLGADQFVIYSVGPDGLAGRCTYATQERAGVPGDYLLFPPAVSLYRRRLIETNQLQ